MIGLGWELDSDINHYLDFWIQASYPQPIVLRHLMTHTAGFQETIRHILVRAGENLRPAAFLVLAIIASRSRRAAPW